MVLKQNQQQIVHVQLESCLWVFIWLLLIVKISYNYMINFRNKCCGWNISKLLCNGVGEMYENLTTCLCDTKNNSNKAD